MRLADFSNASLEKRVLAVLLQAVAVRGLLAITNLPNKKLTESGAPCAILGDKRFVIETCEGWADELGVPAHRLFTITQLGAE